MPSPWISKDVLAIPALAIPGDAATGSEWYPVVLGGFTRYYPKSGFTGVGEIHRHVLGFSLVINMRCALLKVSLTLVSGLMLAVT